jgi:serine/threonine protein phosphatase PrpC
MSNLQSFHQTPFHRWAETQSHLSCERVLGVLAPVIHQLRILHQEGRGHGGISAESLVISLETQQIDLNHFITCGSERIVRGTPYSPPEADAEPPAAPSVQADLYSLAAMLYHALNGQPPVSAAVRQARGDQLAFSSALVTEAERSALLQALALDASQRPASIADLETLLRRKPGLPPAAVQPVPQPPVLLPLEKPAASLEMPILKTVDRLPMNLTKGKPCEIPIGSLFSGVRSEWSVTFCNLEDIGLQLDDTKNQLVGEPTVDGEHFIRVNLSHPNSPPDRPKLERSIKVTINPDPAAIWKNLDSNQDDPHWKPDTDHFALSAPAAFLVAASVRGRSHAQEGLFRDDDFRIADDGETGWILLAVADGAGSAKFSRRGSQLACQQALKYLTDQLRAEADEQGRPTIAKQAANDDPTEEQARSLAYAWLGGAAHAALKAITEEAAVQEPARMPKEYATTLLLAAARKTLSGWIILCFGIGDGGIGLLMRDGTVKVLSSPDSGEFSSETIFLTSKNLWMTTEGISQRLHVAAVPDFNALVLMTDGITDPLFPTEVSLGDQEVWHSFWTDLGKVTQLVPDNPQASAELLQWAGFYSRGNHDDRTIALVLPHPPTPIEA